MRTDFTSDPVMRAELLNAPKYGNDLELPDGYAAMVVEIFHSALVNTGTPAEARMCPVFILDGACRIRGGIPERFPEDVGRGTIRRQHRPLPGTGPPRPHRAAQFRSKVDSDLAPNGYALNCVSTRTRSRENAVWAFLPP